MPKLRMGIDAVQYFLRLFHDLIVAQFVNRLAGGEDHWFGYEEDGFSGGNVGGGHGIDVVAAVVGG